jgi:hypothetical protein
LTLVCHGELYRRRPAPAFLTEFYLWVSLGGVIGGAFAGLAAPYLFNNIYEYPILIVAALLALPGALAGGLPGFVRKTWPVLLLCAGVLAARLIIGSELPVTADFACRVIAVLIVLLILLRYGQPAHVVALVALAFIFTGAWSPGLNRVDIARSFFGVHQVIDTADGRYRVLFHGTTIHGAMRLRDEAGAPVAGKPEPLTYYHSDGPIAQAIAAARETHGFFGNVAVVGLGAGSLACMRRDPERWTFFDIDPEVVRIARDPKLFRYLSSCAADAPIVLGDARLTLAAAPDRYELIVLDAFSSDAIPVHLLTREAFAGYLGRLAPHGAIVVHISNRHLDLAPVVAAAGAELGLTALYRAHGVAERLSTDFRASTVAMVLVRDVADVPALLRQGWSVMPPVRSVRAWTDDYSNILGAMLRRHDR